MDKVLKNISVVDITDSSEGPYSSVWLENLGATVIRVIKRFKNGKLAGFFLKEINSQTLNPIYINVMNEDGRAVFEELLRQCDVFIEDISQQTARDFQLDYSTLKKKNPHLIYCSCFSAEAVYRSKVVSDQTHSLQSETLQDQDFDVPGITATTNAMQSILFSYIYRLQTGEGQFIDMTTSSIPTRTIEENLKTKKGIEGSRPSSPIKNSNTSMEFQTKDYTIWIGLYTQELWETFCAHIIEREDWISRPDYFTPSLRKTNRVFLKMDLDEILSIQEATYWLKKLKNHNISCGLNRLYAKAQ
ncbi:CoA transferase [Peribacillus alkalitolerans]|uniref:CoA transferase n=1 Tax=Peribacillus alkalitolerans TaxID=1550385 RepID=UPI0013D28F1B|nr:CoA transferase [Peribacillus alkalitolerans]